MRLSPKSNQALRRAAVLLVISAGVASCATQPVPAAADPPGFWFGLFHGFTNFFSLIWSIFSDNRVYAFPNSGGWYDAGFVWGAAIFWGSAGASSRRAAT
jgi:hypothetical protein